MNQEASKQSKRHQYVAGVVISQSTQKTLVVKVTETKIHPKYKKRYKVSKTFVAHDESGNHKVGDKVQIRPSRPHSRTKRFEVASITK